MSFISFTSHLLSLRAINPSRFPIGSDEGSWHFPSFPFLASAQAHTERFSWRLKHHCAEDSCAGGCCSDATQPKPLCGGGEYFSQSPNRNLVSIVLPTLSSLPTTLK